MLACVLICRLMVAEELSPYVSPMNYSTVERSTGWGDVHLPPRKKVIPAAIRSAVTFLLDYHVVRLEVVAERVSMRELFE